MKRLLAAFAFSIIMLTNCGSPQVGDKYYAGDYVNLTVVEKGRSANEDTVTIFKDEYTGKYYMYITNGYGCAMTEIDVLNGG